MKSEQKQVTRKENNDKKLSRIRSLRWGGMRNTYTGAAKSLQGAKVENTRRNKGKGSREKDKTL